MDKTYAGGRLRRLRESRSMSQAELARFLEVSPSYINLLEHNSRPLTVPVLVKLTESFGVDLDFFTPKDTARLVADVREVLTTDGEEPASTADLDELATNFPAVARTMVRLHRRYREVSDSLAALAHEHGEGGLANSPTQQPHEEVRDYFYQRQNYVGELDEHAESRAGELRLHPTEIATTLAQHLHQTHSVEVVREQANEPGHEHHFDEHRRVLRLAPSLRPGQAAFRMASQLALLEVSELIDDLVSQWPFSDEITRRLARIGLANYYAGALILPYRAFLSAAERLRYDILKLGSEFGVGFETTCHRLSTLQRPGNRGVPFSFIRVDKAGNVSKRQSATGFHFSRAGGSCPLWIVYDAFGAPGKTLTQIAELPDGKKYFWIARTVSRTNGGHTDPGKTFAIGLGCELHNASRLVYAHGIALNDDAAATPIGPGCKICERPNCPQRAFPTLGKPLTIDENTSTFTPYPTT